MTVIELPNDFVNPYKSRLLATPKKVLKRFFKKKHTQRENFCFAIARNFPFVLKKPLRGGVCVFGNFFLSLTLSKFPPTPLPLSLIHI